MAPTSTQATVLSGETPIALDWSYNVPGPGGRARGSRPHGRDQLPDRRRVRRLLRPGRGRGLAAPGVRQAVARAHPLERGRARLPRGRRDAGPLRGAGRGRSGRRGGEGQPAAGRADLAGRVPHARPRSRPPPRCSARTGARWSPTPDVDRDRSSTRRRGSHLACGPRRARRQGTAQLGLVRARPVLRLPRPVPRPPGDRGVLEGVHRRTGNFGLEALQGRLHRAEPRCVQVLGEALGAVRRRRRRLRRPARLRGRLDPPTEVAAHRWSSRSAASPPTSAASRWRSRSSPCSAAKGWRPRSSKGWATTCTATGSSSTRRPGSSSVYSYFNIPLMVLITLPAIDGLKVVVARGVRQPRRHDVHVLAADRAPSPRAVVARRFPAAVRQLVQRLRDGARR